MSLEDDVRSLRELLTASTAETAAALQRIETRLPPLLGDRARVRELTGLSDASITRRTRSGELRTVKIGGRRLYDLAALAPSGAAEARQLAAEARGSNVHPARG